MAQFQVVVITIVMHTDANSMTDHMLQSQQTNMWSLCMTL